MDCNPASPSLGKMCLYQRRVFSLGQRGLWGVGCLFQLQTRQWHFKTCANATAGPGSKCHQGGLQCQCRFRLVPPALLRLLRWACGPPKPGLPLQFKPISLLTMLNANSAAVAHDNSLPHVLPLTKLQFQKLALQGLAVSEFPPHWSTTWIATLHPHRLERCACINGEYSLSASAGSGVWGACSSCRQDK